MRMRVMHVDLNPDLLPLQVERLASGLRHEPSFVVGALDISKPAAAAFANKMLGVTAVPAVLLYPEAARGCLSFLGAAEGGRGCACAWLMRSLARLVYAYGSHPALCMPDPFLKNLYT